MNEVELPQEEGEDEVHFKPWSHLTVMNVVDRSGG